MRNFIKNCPACNSNRFVNFDNIKFKTSTNTSLKKRLQFKLSQCLNCNNYFNSLFESKNVNFLNPELETFFSHQGTQKSLIDLIDFLKKFFKKISLPEYILDYGCGDGSFLNAIKKEVLLQKNNVRFLGYDIGNSFPISNDFSSNISTLKEFLKDSNKFYFVSCRHVLEHLEKVDIFFQELSHLNNLLVLIEVPNGNRSISNGYFEDLHYDHVSYLSFNSLERMFFNNNIIPISRGNLLNDENIYVLGYRFSNKLFANNSSSLFQSSIISNYDAFSARIDKIAQILTNPNTVFWGVGGRALSILDKVKLSSNEKFSCFLVDSDENKIGIKIPGFHKPVTSFDKINLNSISHIVIGTRVGFPFIKEEIYNKCSSPSFQIIDVNNIY